MARKTKTLHELHSEAEANAERAVAVYLSTADALNAASLSHQTVADQAQAEIDRHTALRDAAVAAANKRAAQAEAIAKLVG